MRPAVVVNHAAHHATTPAANQRTEIRIGTIALEVRTSHPSPPATPAAPAAPQPAAPSLTAPQFSMRRHYLRWG
jgi:hypothetical protein